MTVTSPQVMQRLAPLGGPLAGRAAEMDALRRAWAEAVEGRRRVVLLAGEAGVGKSRLAAELAGEVDASGGAVLVGVCPVGGSEPYQPLGDALGALPAGEPTRDAFLSTLAGAVVARARRAPVLLLLDDLHRAGPSTLFALRRIVERAADAALLVVAAYRDTAVDRAHPLSDFLAAVLPRPGVERISVDGLSPEGLAAMVGDAELAGRLWRQSEGNPVRAGELLRLGTLDAPLPPSFDELVDRRMEALSDPARRFVEAAAVAGSDFQVDVAAAVAGVPGDRVAGVVRQAAVAGLVVEEPVAPGDTRRFVHDMVRESIERRMDSGTRVRLHARIGRALERRGEAAEVPAAVLAWHFRAASPVGRSGAALRHSVRAGERASELLAWEEAAVHFGHALAASGGVRPDMRADLLLSLGEVQRLAGEPARARQAFLEAASLARACADGPRMARAALALGQVAAVWGADAELEELAGEARSLLGHAAPSLDLPATAPATPGPVVFTDFASDALYDVLDGVPPAPPPEPVVTPAALPPRAKEAGAEVVLLRARHLALAGPEHAAERLAAAEDLVALGARAEDERLAVEARGARLVDALALGRLDVAAVDQAAHARLAHRLDDPRHAADAAAWSAMKAMVDGRAEDARSAAAQAFALAVEAGDPEADDAFLLQRWWLALEWGTDIELQEVAGACRVRASSAAAGRAWRSAAALALARNGRLDLAAEELRRVVDHGLGELVRDPGRLHPLACLAEVAWMLGDGYRAATVGPLLEPFADHMAVAGRGWACHGLVARACGLVAASAHRWDEAERHFEAALAVHRRMGALPLLARTRFEWSRLLLERGRKGDRRRATDSERKAAELAGRLGMSRLLEELARPRP